MMSKILIIEDDEVILRFLTLALKKFQYEVFSTRNGFQGYDLFMEEHPQLVLLDLGLPDIDGLDVITQIRSQSQVPIIIISARGKERDKIAGLDAGADDYITKPFNIGELSARVRVALRRTSIDQNIVDIITIRDITADFSKRRIVINNQVVHFTPIEYRIIELLVRNKGKVLTHAWIQREVWGYETSDDFQTLRVFMASIRRKIEIDPTNPQYIMTEIGVGYRFVDE